jgi:hypothetical protein
MQALQFTAIDCNMFSKSLFVSLAYGRPVSLFPYFVGTQQFPLDILILDTVSCIQTTASPFILAPSIIHPPALHFHAFLQSCLSDFLVFPAVAFG